MTFAQSGKSLVLTIACKTIVGHYPIPHHYKLNLCILLSHKVHVLESKLWLYFLPSFSKLTVVLTP